MKIQKEFYNSEQMMQDAKQIIENNIKELLHIENYYDEKMQKSFYYYSGIRMTMYNPDIELSIDKVYENGIVYNIICNKNYFTEYHNIYTVAKLVCINGQKPELLIVNPKIDNKRYEEMFALLGKGIDDALFDHSENVFNKHRKQKIRELTQERITLTIKQSLETLTNNSKSKKAK